MSKSPNPPPEHSRLLRRAEISMTMIESGNNLISSSLVASGDHEMCQVSEIVCQGGKFYGDCRTSLHEISRFQGPREKRHRLQPYIKIQVAEVRGYN